METVPPIFFQVGSHSTPGHIVGCGPEPLGSSTALACASPSSCPRELLSAGLELEAGAEGGGLWCFVKTVADSCPELLPLCPGLGGIPGKLSDHLRAADPLWTTPSLPLPIGSPSREQSAKATRGPGSPSGDRVVLVGKAVSFQREPECRACTPREWCQG